MKIIFGCSFMIILVMIFAFSGMAHGSTLSLTVMADKQTYNSLEEVLITGNVILDGSPVSDTLVAVEIDDPENQPFAISTLSTGPNVTGPWNVEISEIITCGRYGDPKYVFPRGGDLAYKVTVKNNMANSYNVVVTLTFFYANSAPFMMLIPFTGSLGPGQARTIGPMWPIPIPSDAVTGEAMACANVYSNLPKAGGFPYCPEKSAIFNITSGDFGASIPADHMVRMDLPEGSYSLTIAFPSLTTTLGNYTIYAVTHYSPLMASSETTFKLGLTGDLYSDGKIDMKDIAIVAVAFGTVPEDPNWNPVADLNKDNRVDMRDIAVVAKLFGMQE